MEAPFSNIAWFEEVKKRDIATAGGKGANLGEMASAIMLNLTSPFGY